MDTFRDTLHSARATCEVIIQKGRGHLDSRQKGCSYPSKKTAHETDLRLQRYKLVKSVGWSCRVGWCRVVSGRAAHTDIFLLNHGEIAPCFALRS